MLVSPKPACCSNRADRLVRGVGWTCLQKRRNWSSQSWLHLTEKSCAGKRERDWDLGITWGVWRGGGQFTSEGVGNRWEMPLVDACAQTHLPVVAFVVLLFGHVVERQTIE